jgi:hypothetical protein
MIAIVRGNSVHDPVGPNFTRVIIKNRHAGFDTWSHHEWREAKILMRKFLHDVVHGRNDTRNYDPLDGRKYELCGREQAA